MPQSVFISVHGICYQIAAGNVQITLRAHTTNYAQSHIGYATNASRLYVEELGQSASTPGRA